jgi:hypothetical protein
LSLKATTARAQGLLQAGPSALGACGGGHPAPCCPSRRQRGGRGRREWPAHRGRPEPAHTRGTAAVAGLSVQAWLAMAHSWYMRNLPAPMSQLSSVLSQPTCHPTHRHRFVPASGAAPDVCESGRTAHLAPAQPAAAPGRAATEVVLPLRTAAAASRCQGCLLGEGSQQCAVERRIAGGRKSKRAGLGKLQQGARCLCPCWAVGGGDVYCHGGQEGGLEGSIGRSLSAEAVRLHEVVVGRSCPFQPALKWLC